MCRNGKLFCGLLVALFLSWSGIASATADHVLTDQQYLQLIHDLTQLQQIQEQQKTLLSAQAATIASSQASLTKALDSLPTLKQSFDLALQQDHDEIVFLRVGCITLSVVAVGALIYSVLK